MSIQGLLNKNMAVDSGNGIKREDAFLKPMRSMWLKRQVTVVKNGNHYDVTCERHNSISEKWLEVTGSPFVFVSGGNFASVFAYLLLVPYAVGSMLALGVTNLFMSIPLAVDLVAKKLSLHGNQNAKAYQSIIENALEYESFVRKHPNRSNKTLDQLQTELEIAKARKENSELDRFNFEEASELYLAKEQEMKLQADLKAAVENYHQLTSAQDIEEEIECEFNKADTATLRDVESPKESPQLAHFKELHTQIIGLEAGLSKISDAAIIAAIHASIATLKDDQNKAITELQDKNKRVA